MTSLAYNITNTTRAGHTPSARGQTATNILESTHTTFWAAVASVCLPLTLIQIFKHMPAQRVGTKVVAELVSLLNPSHGLHEVPATTPQATSR